MLRVECAAVNMFWMLLFLFDKITTTTTTPTKDNDIYYDEVDNPGHDTSTNKPL